MTKRALISVSDKADIVEFAQELKKLGWDIISTGGTKVALDNAGVDTIAIDDVTGFPEMMDGRVKTLHPNIHGGLLARRDLDSHLEAAKKNQIELIDLVVVNLYPFKETILKPDVTYADAVENIDIGGPSMLRSAAKNHASVTVVRTRRNAHTPNTPNAVPNTIKTTDSNIGKRGSIPANVDTCAEMYINNAQIKHITGGGILVSKFILLPLYSRLK